MNNKRLLLTCTLLACLLAAGPVLAQDEASVPTTREMVDQGLAEMRERLDVSDYTWEQVHLILKTSIRERIAIAKKYGLDGGGEALEELSGREKRRMKRELKNVRKSTEDRMERYLDKEQMKVFEEIQEEIHAEMHTRVEERIS